MGERDRFSQGFLARFFLVFSLFCAVALPIAAQVTTVSGTVADTNGIPYAGGQIKAQLVLAGTGVTGQPVVTVNNQQQCASAGQGSAPCKIPFPGTQGPLALDGTGSFTINLQDNSLVTPAGTQWLFTVTISPGVAPPLGTGPQTCSSTLTITGTSQSITSSFLACPILSLETTGPLSGVVNVKNFPGTFGNTQSVTSGFSWNTAGNGSVTCAACNFTSSDVGKTIYVSGPSNGVANLGIIASVSGGVANLSNQTVNGGQQSILVWGNIDDAGANAAGAAVAVLLNGYGPSFSQTVTGKITRSATLYWPAGGYMLCGTAALPEVPQYTGFVGPNTTATFRFIGDGAGQTVFYPCPNIPTPTTFNHVWLNSNFGSAVRFNIEQDWSINGAFVNFGNRYFSLTALAGYVEDVDCSASQNLASIALPCALFSTGSTRIERFYGAQNQQVAVQVLASDIDFYRSTLSNNGVNLLVTNLSGAKLGGGASGFRWLGGLLDECSSTVACEQVTNSIDVYFIGTGIFSATGVATASAISLDSTSIVHMTDVVCGQFSGGNCFNNAAGGMLILNDVRMYPAAGTGCWINNGTVITLGLTTCMTGVTLAASNSATESGNTVTITTNGAAHGFHVGDYVQCGGQLASQVGGNISVAAYNGTWQVLTVPSSTTFTYRNPTAALGNGNGGGCTGFVSGGTPGNPFFAAVSHAQWNCGIPTLTATSTTANTPCYWIPDQNIRINQFNVGVNPAPSGCATNAVVQITNGTFTQNVTISAAQNNVSLLDQTQSFTNISGQQISAIITTAAAGCATTPANAQINMLWQGLT